MNEIFITKTNNPFSSIKHGLSLFMEESKEKMSLTKSLFISFFLHILFFVLGFFILQAIIILLMYLGFDLSLFDRPKAKIRDIEFVLLNPEKYNVKKSFTKKTTAQNNRALAGPRPDKRMYSDDEGGLKSIKKSKITAASNVVNETPQKNTRKAVSQANIPLAKTPKKGSSAPILNMPSPFAINMPKVKTISDDVGFGAGSKQGYHSPSAGSTSVISDGEGAGGSGKGDSVGTGERKGGGGYYYGTAGTPKPGSANQYGNDANDVDLRPYVTELQRKIVRNWAMPSSGNNKKTVLFLRISKSGSLMVLNIRTPSGDPVTDNSAIAAVKKAQPFNALPAGYKNSYADVILTFDYNVSARQN
ncbi:MAG: cell envelope integrity protein TolA [Candidatus Gastranaerophilales bacterium]|nr:cell envelope integrity protein TolA [Candidatus Gastranaerophilales bacterium]